MNIPAASSCRAMSLTYREHISSDERGIVHLRQLMLRHPEAVKRGAHGNALELCDKGVIVRGRDGGEQLETTEGVQEDLIHAIRLNASESVHMKSGEINS